METRPHRQLLITSSCLCFHGLKPYGKHIFLTKNQETWARQILMPLSRRKQQSKKCSVAVKTLELLGYFTSLWEQRDNRVKVGTGLEKPGHMAIIPNQPAN